MYPINPHKRVPVLAFRRSSMTPHGWRGVETLRLFRVNVGPDRGQLSSMAEQARTAIGSETIAVIADRGYYAGEEILACEEASIAVYLPKPLTSGANAEGRFGKQDFVSVAAHEGFLYCDRIRRNRHWSVPLSRLTARYD